MCMSVAIPDAQFLAWSCKVHTYQPVQNQKRDKISEKADFWSKIRTFLRIL